MFNSAQTNVLFKVTPQQTLTFPKQFASSEIKLRIHRSANKLEEFIFDNGLQSFQDASHGKEKLLRRSYGMGMHKFLGTACACKEYRLFLPTNSSNTKLGVLCEAIFWLKQHRLILTSLGIPTSKPTKAFK